MACHGAIYLKRRVHLNLSHRLECRFGWEEACAYKSCIVVLAALTVNGLVGVQLRHGRVLRTYPTLHASKMCTLICVALAKILQDVFLMFCIICIM